MSRVYVASRLEIIPSKNVWMTINLKKKNMSQWEN